MKYCFHCMQAVAKDKASFCPSCGKKLETKVENGKYLVPGTILQHRYVVGEHIGAGGFGITYIGLDANLRRKVCIKEFYPEKYCDRADDHLHVTTEEGILEERYKKGLKAFLQEAKNIAALQDIKGVVKIYAFFEENNTGYIVMEYLEGKDVREILKSSGNHFDYDRARRIVLSVLFILREIHKRGVIHRDISPDNIFVTNDGVITLIDFGAAKYAAAYYNPDAEVVLKEGYAPIEQYSRSGRQGAYTDLYAVAALFYRLLTGMKPLPANERLYNDTLIPPSEMGIRIPEQAELGMMVCLNIKAEYRLQNAEQFMECLDGLSFEPIYEPGWILPPVVEPKKGFIEWLAFVPLPVKLLLCLCLIVTVCGTTIFGLREFRKDKGGEEVAVENENVLKDYVGQDYNSVLDELKNAGHTNISMRYELSGKEKGEILAQSIPAGGYMDENENLLFTVSGRDEIFTMPDLTGKSKNQVLDYYTGLNYDVASYNNPYNDKKSVKEGSKKADNFKKKRNKITIKTEFNDSIKKNKVIRQSVEAGEQCDTNQEIEIIVSLGKKADYMKKIPDFSGMSKEEVTKKLEEENLTDYVQVNYKENAGYSNQYPQGTVMAQDIEAGFKTNILKLKGLNKKKKILLSLSSGQQPLKVETPKSQSSVTPAAPATVDDPKPTTDTNERDVHWNTPDTSSNSGSNEKSNEREIHWNGITFRW